jgi:hypothetical protein
MLQAIENRNRCASVESLGVPRNPQASEPYGDFGQLAALASAMAATAAVTASSRSSLFIHPDPFID